MRAREQTIENVRDFFGLRIRRGFEPLTRALQRLHITPNQVTVAGALLNVAAAALVVRGDLLAAGVVFVLGSCLDMLDGTLARLAKMVTPFGAFLDSTLDRASEGIVLAAVAYRLAAEGREVDAGLVVVAVLGSFLVSYTRARAEALGVECKVGLMSRPERVVLVAVGLFFNVLPYVVYILAALTTLTVVQRVLHTQKQLRGRGATAPPPSEP
jgi:CDP-diacylglycerol--glycerol-3-phosphate 3-phosphatidyltransferase